MSRCGEYDIFLDKYSPLLSEVSLELPAGGALEGGGGAGRLNHSFLLLQISLKVFEPTIFWSDSDFII